MNTRSQYTVLLIDDDEKLATLLQKYLAKFDMLLLSASHPTDGLSQFQASRPNLVILDVMMPEMDGFEVCRRLRKISNTPIIMLTARGDVNDRVVGLALGADDYLPKPFEPRELVARIMSILQRVSTDEPEELQGVIHLGNLTINKNSRVVTVSGQSVDLSKKEFTLLTMLVETPGKIYSRNQLAEALGGVDAGIELNSRSVDILISRLRNKLKPADDIETVWGEGYRFRDE